MANGAPGHIAVFFATVDTLSQPVGIFGGTVVQDYEQ